MVKEELKLLIHNYSMSILLEYNLLCNEYQKKTPDEVYPPLIEECDKNLTVNVYELLKKFDERNNIMLTR